MTNIKSPIEVVYDTVCKLSENLEYSSAELIARETGFPISAVRGSMEILAKAGRVEIDFPNGIMCARVVEG